MPDRPVHGSAAGPISITLEPLCEPDLPGILAAISSAEALVQWAGPKAFRFPLDLAQLRQYLAGAQTGPEAPRILKALDADGAFTGMIEIGLIDRQNGSASLCRILVLPEYRQRGVCAAMLRAALRIGFEDLGLRRIDLRVYAFNTAAIHCYERAGFAREGLLRQGQRVGAQLWDVVLMGLLRDDWLAGRYGQAGAS